MYIPVSKVISHSYPGKYGLAEGVRLGLANEEVPWEYVGKVPKSMGNPSIQLSD